jgi:hypothetical protein
MDGKILHLIALRGKMELKFVQNAKSKVNFVFVLEIVFQLGNLSCACQHNSILGLKFAANKRKNCKKSNSNWTNWANWTF